MLTNKKLSTRLRNARLRQPACLEDIDYSLTRGLTKAQMLELSTSRWVAQAHNVLVTGPTGVGKSFVACALGHKACRDGYGVVYRRASRLFDELAQARADGTHAHLLRRLAKTQVLILDDFGLEPLGASERKELLEILEDRYGTGATVVTINPCECSKCSEGFFTLSTGVHLCRGTAEVGPLAARAPQCRGGVPRAARAAISLLGPVRRTPASHQRGHPFPSRCRSASSPCSETW